MTEKNLIGIEREDLRLGEAALDLDGEHGFLHFAVKGAIGREKQIARQLHGEGGGALKPASRLNVAIGSADNPPEVDSGVTVEVFVFYRDERVTQQGRKIFV